MREKKKSRKVYFLIFHFLIVCFFLPDAAEHPQLKVQKLNRGVSRGKKKSLKSRIEKYTFLRYTKYWKGKRGPAKGKLTRYHCQAPTNHAS